MHETKYQLKVINYSKNYGDICVFQTLPDQPDNLLSLAWFSKAVHPNTAVEFNWSMDYSFTWTESEALRPGAVFSAEEEKKINLEVPAKTASALSVSNEDKPFFKQTEQTVPAGEIGILTDQTMTGEDYAIGINVAGAPAFAMQAEPDLHFTFRPHPQYWVALGDFKKGEVLPPEIMEDAVPIDLNETVSACKLTLSPDGAITVP